MKIVVCGAGAVGGYFGGRMLEAGMDVTFLVREHRAQQLAGIGLVIQSPLGDASLWPKVATNAEQIDGCDLVILAVKNYHLDDVMDSIRKLVGQGAKVLPLLNGVEHYDKLAYEFGREAVLGGLCHIIATLDNEGRIIHTNRLHHATFGWLEEEQEGFCRQFYEAVQGVNSKWVMSQHVLSDIWNKYIFITAFSGVTTASRLPIDEILANPSTTAVLRDAITEMVRLSAAEGAPQPDGLVDFLLEQVTRQPKGSTSSMHQDLRKGLRLEVESLQGAAVRRADAAGVDVPVLRTLYGLIKPHELP